MEDTKLKRKEGSSLSGKKLIGLAKKIMRFERILDHVDKRKMDKELLRSFVLENTLTPDSLKKKKQKELANILSNIETYLKNIAPTFGSIEFKIEDDTEHEGTRVICQTRRNGSIRESVLDTEFIVSPEFTELRRLTAELGELGEAPYLLVNGQKEMSLTTYAEVVEFLFDQGKRGQSIQRYKGLGEMNPEQLWETTMDPERRTLLQVNIEDSVEADEIFTILMGDEVEQRRQFIEKHALDVKNLDV